MIWEPGAQYLRLRLPDREKYRVTPRPGPPETTERYEFPRQISRNVCSRGVALRVETVGRPGPVVRFAPPTDGWARTGGHRPNGWGHRWNTGPSRREHRDETGARLNR